jgi:mRNA-degrading endonuclease RelE of RelBE toxin-antitoxin system
VSWQIDLSNSAIKELKALPRDRREQVIDAIDAMEKDPLAGDVRALQGKEWKGRYRKRTGRYRIIFSMDLAEKRVAISAVLTRSEKTYRLG